MKIQYWSMVTTDADGDSITADVRGTLPSIVTRAIRCLSGSSNWKCELWAGGQCYGSLETDWSGRISSVDIINPMTGEPWSPDGVGA